MKLSKRVISLVLSLIMVITVISVGVVGVSAAENKYSTAAMALDSEYAYDGELGAIYSPEATEFRVWSPSATEVKLNLYATGSDQEEGAKDIAKIDMEKMMDGENFTGVWTTRVEGDQKGVYYTYSVTRPDSILGGTPVTKETQDIYSYAVGVNGNRSMVVDLDDTDPEGWDNDSHVLVENQTDAVVWEVQVKDFSYSESSGVSEPNRGKFLAFTETGTTLNDEGQIATCVDYLKSLGVTHVQINPFYDFATVDETGPDSQFNWGYDPKNYGVPEGSYSSNPYDGNVRIKECKQMIQALHNAGIGVIMDVVYNHTYSRESCFTACVPMYYYRMTAAGAYSDQSGCGNDTASERAMYRKYMREMLQYWTNEYHIDGYRFDLMGVHDGETMNIIRDDMDQIDPRIIMFGEGWSGGTVFDPKTCTGGEVFGTTQTNAGKISTRIGFFNDVIRDGIKGGVFDGPTSGGFVSGVFINSPKITSGLRAQTFNKNQNWTAVAPTQTVSYASCHDNNTLYDKLVNVNRGLTVDYRARYGDVIRQNKLAGAIVNMSQGIDFFLAGEEMGRSKDGDENSYKSPAEENMIDWNLLTQNADLVSYYKGLIEVRKAFSPLRAITRDQDDDSFNYNWTTSISNSSRQIAFTIDNTAKGEWSKVAFLFNSQEAASKVTLKDEDITDNTEWVIIVNDEGAGVTKLAEAKGKSLTVAGQSALVAVEKSTFEAAAIKSDLSSVLVRNTLEDTGEVYSQYLLKGKVGEGYVSSYDTSVPLKYDLGAAVGDTTGVFTDAQKVVDYFFVEYTPNVFKEPNGDVNDDGVVDILDATTLQKAFALIITLDEEHLKRGDYNCDGYTDIADVTCLQKYLAKFPLFGIKTVTTNHYESLDGGERVISPTSVDEYRYGEEYTTSPAPLTYYSPIGTPDNATGIATKDVVVNYYYQYKVKEVNIHVKHEDESQTWAPSLWAWIHDDQTGQETNIYDSWPGLTMKKGESGWYETTITVPDSGGFSAIISKNGSPQTKDYTGLKYDDLYIIINDSKIVNQGDWLTFYEGNPED